MWRPITYACSLLILALSAWTSYAVGGKSLLPDGSFENVRQEQLAEGWFVESEDVYDGTQCLRFSSSQAPTGWHGCGYIQKVPLDSGHTYAVRYAAKAIDWTSPSYLKPFLRLRLYDEHGKYIKYQSAGGVVFARAGNDMWIPHIYYFQLPEGAAEGRLEPEHYQCKGTVLIDAVSVVDLGPVPEPRELLAGERRLVRVPTPEPHAKPVFGTKQNEQGFAIFQRDEPGFVFPNSYPSDDEIATRIETYAAQGQYCAIGFAVYPLRPMREVSFELTDLAGPRDQRIPPADCDLKRVRYWPQVVGIAGGGQFAVIPEILEPMRREAAGNTARFMPLPTEYDWSERTWRRVAEATFSAEESQLLWLSVGVPDGIDAGTYTGTICIRARGLPQADVEVVLKVLPFRLVRPRKQFQGFYLYDQRFDAYTDEQLEAEFREMRRFGVEAVLLSLENVPRLGYRDGLEIVVTDVGGRKRVAAVKSRRLERVLAAFNQAGMRGPIVVGYNPMISRHVAKALGRPKEEGADKRQWSQEVHQGMVDVFRGTSAIMAKYGQDRNWAMALKDEAQMPYKLHVQQEAALAKRAGIMTYLAGGRPVADHVADALDLLTHPRVYSESQNAERVRWCREHGVRYWFYEGGAYTNQDGKVFPNRYFSGFQLIKTGAQCHMGYTFQDGAPNPWNEFVSRSGMSWNTTYPLNPEVGWTEGPFVSTLQWEGYKLGFVDACYWATLEHCIARARARGGSKSVSAATRAAGTQAQVLAQVPYGIDCHYHYPSGPICAAAVPELGFHNREANALRRTLAEEILRLEALLDGE